MKNKSFYLLFGLGFALILFGIWNEHLRMWFTGLGFVTCVITIFLGKEVKNGATKTNLSRFNRFENTERVL